jgi:hypothetical protein
MLHFCTFEDAASLLVDAEDDDAAKTIARDVAGEEPERVIVLKSGAFVAEVVIDDEDEDEETEPLVTIDPLEHTADLLATLETGEAHGSIDVDACGESADLASGEAVFCELERGHDGKHEARAGSSGEIAEW